jgi:hypothetical protein
MSIFNAIMNGLFDALCFPFQGLPPLVGLAVISALSGVVLLVLYKYTSPQRAIKKVKDRIKAGLLEIRLFKDDLGIVSGAIGRLFLRDIPFYLGCNIIPLVPLIIIVLPILVQLDTRYGFEPLRPGDRFVLEATLSEGLDPVNDAVELNLPDGLKLEAGPVRIPSKREVACRIMVERESEYEVAIRVCGQEFVKKIEAAATRSALSTARYSASRTLDVLFHPAESPLPAGAPLESVKIRNHSRASMLGIDGDLWPWLWIFCIVGLAFGFALKGVFRVNI